MTDYTSEIDKEITYLCELMGIDRNQIRYIMLNGAEFVGETIVREEPNKSFNSENSDKKTAFFHPMKINVDIDVSDDGHLVGNKYFTEFNPYSVSPYEEFANYNILTQSRITDDLMFEYLCAVYETYFTEDGKEMHLIESSIVKNNIVDFQEFKNRKDKKHKY